MDSIPPVDFWRPRDLSSYGLSCDTRILCSDFQWRLAGTLASGDRIVAFEEQILCGHRRKMVLGTVVSSERAIRPSYRLTFTGGREMIVGQEHSLLSGDRGGAWARARYLKAARQIRDLGIPWLPGITWEHGWLGGVFDGEANLSSTNSAGGGWHITFTQNPGAVLDLAEHLMKEMGYETRRKTLPGRHVQRLAITGIYDCFRFLGECRPLRLVGKAEQWIPPRSSARSRGSRRDRRYNAVLEAVEYVGERELVVLETDCRTMFAEGLFAGAGVAHKSRTVKSTMRT